MGQRMERKQIFRCNEKKLDVVLKKTFNKEHYR